MGHYTYEILPDCFAHPLEGDGEPLIAVPERFGLIDESPDRWTRLRAKLAEMNSTTSADDGAAVYKLLFLIRHGQGFHNVAEAKYGTQAWDDYWSKLEGDGEIVWGPDPLLTPTGLDQAKEVRSVWERELAAGLGTPSKVYSSPFSRVLKTCFIAFDGLLEDDSKVLIVESVREENGVHTCDKRSARSFIHKEFPKYTIEDGFTEEDELWSPDVRETKAEVADRAGIVLDRIFDENPTDEAVLSVTAHNGFINGVLKKLGKAPYLLPTGGVLPLLLRATKASKD
ncbi:phosphoglycerate mutase [Coprinopsis marcescibilis]|uniref:Phosphoglycerate mutase n=1 Tax=Coprinopsis marcescibilis TaxID=230819 RepID=A0A5C3KQC8_COPMA|nr:phosphoglycerate mutase [Coprinopsis marcescibilis]